MGTKFEYTLNILEASASSNSFTVHFVDEWEHLQTRGTKANCCTTAVGNFDNSMDKNLGNQNTEYIRRTMQLHEDIFKDQVRELHRLYNVQKILTDELKKQVQKNRGWSSAISEINHVHSINPHHPTIQTIYAFNFNLQSIRDDPSSKERSGSCSGDTMRVARGFDLEKPAEQDISTGVSAVDEDQAGTSCHIPLRSHKSIDGSDEGSEVELTLSVGGRVSKKTLQSYHPNLGSCESSHQRSRELDSSASFKSDRREDCSDPTTSRSSSSATFDQERSRSHWLFQGLKLK